MNFLSLSLASALLWGTTIGRGAPDTNAQTIYLFTSFRGNGDGLHLAWSEDARTWTDLGSVFLRPTVGSKLMRDPQILRGPDGLFHMVWTSGWGDKGIGYATSTDFVNWSEQRYLPLMEKTPGTKNCWAPETFYDSGASQYIVMWSSNVETPGTTPPKGGFFRAYYSLTRDFNTFTEPKILFDPGFNNIDTTMLEADGKYFLVFKETDDQPAGIWGGIHGAMANKPLGPYTLLPEPIIKNERVEGPALVAVGGKTLLYADYYVNQRYGVRETSDWKTWKDATSDTRVVPGQRHGSILPITRAELRGLAPNYDRTPPPPALPGVNADPHIAVFGDTFYLYPTTDGSEGWRSTSFRAWSSRDLVHWRDEGVILDLPRDLTWANLHAWAPAVATRNGKYYFYYSAAQNVGVAVADSPVGPFKDPLGKPLVAKTAFRRMQAIDPMVFVDDDGSAYLYWGQGRCKAVMLNDDMISFNMADVRDITPPGYNEGPFVHKRKGKYYLSWSEFDTRDPRYSVAYATGVSPLGPFTKAAKNPILHGSGPVQGAGHHSIVQIPGRDEWVIAYHRFRIPDGNGYNRETCLSPLRYADDGSILPVDVFEAPAIQGRATSEIRPPAVPLVACDPYFSIWSPEDRLTDADTMHWTGQAQRLVSLVRIDGENYRLMGTQPAGVPPLRQARLEVLPTRTIYTFAGAGVELTLTFMTPALPEDLDVLSRPVTYVTWEAKATDKQQHNVSVYLDARAEIACNTPNQAVNFQKADSSGIKAWRVGTVDQPVLQKKGDDLRIDWGYFYVASPSAGQGRLTANLAAKSRESFETDGTLPASPAEASLENNTRNDTVIAYASDLGSVGNNAASCWLMLAYDDSYSIQYMKKNLRPYWRRHGWGAADLLEACANDYASLQKRCEAFDEELMSDLRQAGGENYALLGALAYRQCFAAGKFVADENGRPLQFCKENHSNGCVGTADVFYPMSPQFLLFGPTLAKSFIVPYMNYAASERWKFPFAPHDLGTYPLANGQVYGGGEREEENQMPVEESGNLLILFAAVAEMEGNANFAGIYWKQLAQWAQYLKQKGFDPENQLCTDDFAGHLAHNANLSVKAICGLGAFAKLCEMRGEPARAKDYSDLARQLAQRWMKEGDDGDHYRLAFDRPGTWSQKYNLMWDRILGLNLFPASVAEKEMAFYHRIQNRYGLPLDNRKDYTKLDWITWTATLTQKREDFEALINPIVAFLNATPDRTPMTDWYDTRTARRVGFDARPVVGGVFAQMLYDKAVWNKYARRDKTRASGWAPMPKPPKVTVIVPAADTEPAEWSYTTSPPAKDWMKPGFEASGWQEGRSGFGTPGTPSTHIGTLWNTGDIWLRREVNLPPGSYDDVQAWLRHDEDAQVYINGVLAVKVEGWNDNYDTWPLTAPGRAALRPGRNLIAIHCHQTSGGQCIDLGFVRVQDPER